MVIMTESNVTPGGSTVLQKLLAERFRNEVDDKINRDTEDSFGSKDEFKNGSAVEYYSDILTTQDVNIDNHLQHPPSPLPRSTPNPLPRTIQGDPASRLDALCRSTLDKSEEQNTLAESRTPTQIRTHSDVSDQDSYSENSRCLPAVSPFVIDQHFSRTSGRFLPSHDQLGYEGGSTEVTVSSSKSEIVTRSTPSLANGLVSPRVDSVEDSTAYVYQRAKGIEYLSKLPLDYNFIDVNRKPQFNGHLKSRSGGDDYLYTDYMRSSKLNHRPCIRSNRIKKSNSSSMKRSNSFHQNKQAASMSGDSTFSQPIRSQKEEYRSSPMLDSTNDIFNNNIFVERKSPAALSNVKLSVIPSGTLERTRKRLSYGSSYSVPEATTPTPQTTDIIQVRLFLDDIHNIFFICSYTSKSVSFSNIYGVFMQFLA